MTYDIYLTQASDEAKAELAKQFDMCACCDFEDSIWLSAIKTKGGMSIHGAGCFDEETPVKGPTPEKTCQFSVVDALAHGNTVILTPDVKEFISLINKYLKQ